MESEHLFISWDKAFKDFTKPKNDLLNKLIILTKDEDNHKKNEDEHFEFTKKDFLAIGFGFKNFLTNNSKYHLDDRYPTKKSLNRWLKKNSISEESLREFFSDYLIERCIKVFVKKQHESEITHVLESKISSIMKELGHGDVSTDVVESSDIVPTASSPFITPNSGGNISLSGGTIGCVVRGTRGQDVMLSCAHVFVDPRNTLETRIISNAKSVGQTQVIGNWTNYELKTTQINQIDAAIAEPSKNISLSRSHFSRVEKPTTIGIVTKMGAASGVTSGVITSGSLQTIGDVKYPYWGLMQFTDVYTIFGMTQRIPPNNKFSISGDSGSIVKGSNDEAVGMIFANSKQYNDQSFMCLAQNIEQKLKIKF